jgi:hypothetical protein
MSTPYIQGLIHDGDGRTVQFMIGPDGYRQWGWSGPTGGAQDAMAKNLDLLGGLEWAAQKAGFFEDPEEKAWEQEEAASGNG